MSRRNSKRWVYLIGSPAARPVKIGVSDDPEARLADLQTGSPVPLVLLWKTTGATALEKALHAYFAPYRTHGEWFDFGDENPVALVATAAVLMGHRTQPDRIPQPARYLYGDCTSCATRAAEEARKATAPKVPAQAHGSGQPRACETEVPASPAAAVLLLLAAAGPDGVSVAEVRAATGLGKSQAYALLADMVESGDAVKPRHGRYAAPGTEAAA